MTRTVKRNPPERGRAGLKFIALCVMLVQSSFSFAQESTVLNIDSCHAMARRNHPLIRQYELIDKSRDYTISNANKAFLPQVSITGIGAYIISGLPSITLPNSEPVEKSDVQFIGIGQLNQAIWDGGATHAQKDLARANAETDKAGLDVSLFEIRERVNQLYFGILVIDEQLKQLDILKDNLTRNLHNLQLTKDNGLTYQSDVDQVKTELLLADQKEIEINFTRKGFVDMLGFMTGSSYPENVRLEKPVIVESYTSLTNIRPELNLFANQRRAVEATSAFDKVTLMPKFGLMGAGILIEPGMSFATSTISSLALAGVSVSWNISGLYKYSNNKKLRSVQMDRINSQQDAFLFSNNLQLMQVSSDIEKQKAILMKDGEIVLLRRGIKDAYQLKYDNGMCSMTDLINSMNKENEARSSQALHEVQLLMSLYNYRTKTGH